MIIDWNFVISPKLQVLSDADIKYLYARALEIIKCVGVRVLNSEALELLRAAGSFITDNSIVKIQSYLVEDAIRSVPKRLVIYDREGNPAMELGGGNTGGRNTYYGTGSDLRYTYDLKKKDLRLTIAKDVANMAKVVDFLAYIDFVMSYGIPSDCQLGRVYQTEFVQMVKNTTKPIIFTSDNGKVCNEIIEMAALVVGGIQRLKEKPFIIAYSQPTSPLQHSEDALGKVFACAESNIPVVYPPGMIPGATAPTTIAGAIVQSLAESLSALTIHQLKAKGAPMILGGAHGCMDMQTSVNVYAAPERLMTQAVLASVYQYFGIPTWGFGGCSDAINLDDQAGAEFGMMSIWAALSGINLAHDVGYLGSGMIGDLRAIVFNDEINSYVRYLLCRGLHVNNENLAIDVIESVGHGGNFLADQHTLDHFRTELWKPSILNRADIKTWNEAGRKQLKDKLGEKVSDILESHQSKGLDSKISIELEKVLTA